MSKPANLQALVERYLRERRRLGFGMRDAVYALRSFARHLDTIEHHRPLTAKTMSSCALLHRPRIPVNLPQRGLIAAELYIVRFCT
jgi:hypothetical protein